LISSMPLCLNDNQPTYDCYTLSLHDALPILFPQFKVNELAQFPVPDLNSEEQDKIADKVSVIMSKAQSKQDYSKENLEVDELVMEAYGLTEEEKQEVRDFTV